MRPKTKASDLKFSELILSDISTLQFAISVGKKTAEKVGDEAHARVQVNRLVLWNVDKIYRYLSTQGIADRPEIERDSKTLINTKELKKLLSTGYQTATTIGEQADAKVRIGRFVLWDINKIQCYIDNISQ
jgi:predicted transcriptional regulator